VRIDTQDIASTPHQLLADLCDYVPIFLSEVPWFITQPQLRPHIALLNVSPWVNPGSAFQIK
jgi:hypothetical protein